MVLAVNIDFDKAQTAWRSNKRYIGNGSFVYITKKPKKKTTDKYVSKRKPCKYNLRSSNSTTSLTDNINNIIKQPIHNYNLRSTKLG